MKKIILLSLLLLFFACGKEDGLPPTYLKITKSYPKTGAQVSFEDDIYIYYAWRISPNVLEKDGFYIQHEYMIDDREFFTYGFDKREINSRAGKYDFGFRPFQSLYPVVPEEKFTYLARIYQRNREKNHDVIVAESEKIVYYLKKK